MFVCKTKTHNIMVLKNSIRCFDLTLRLKVNLQKSRIGGINRFSAVLNSNTMTTPFTYLGMSMGGTIREIIFGKV